MSTLADLRRALTEYDGKATTILSEAAAEHRHLETFLSNLVTLASDTEDTVSDGATWILKAELEAGTDLAKPDTKRLITSLTRITAWQAQLHICQSLSRITVPKAQQPDLEKWLAPLLTAKRPFLRAWSADALSRLWGASPETDALLTRMETDSAGSVRARIRALRREFS